MSELLEWFRTTDDLVPQILRHLQLSFVPLIIAMAVALPLGLYIGHARRLEFTVVTIANLGRAIPSFAILALALPLSIKLGLGLGFWPTVSALFLLSLPPLITNTYIGVKGVDPDTVEAARGMGLSGLQILRSIELPLAVPLIVTGIRTAAVQCVATATLASLIAGGGLGDYIRLGIRTGNDQATVGGALLVALLALAIDFFFSLTEKAVSPTTGAPRPPFRVEPIEEMAQLPRPADAF